MEKTLDSSIDKLYNNRLSGTDESFEEFVEGLSEVGTYICEKKEIENISACVQRLVSVFDDENIADDCIDSVKSLLFALVEYNYIDTKELFSELLDNLPHFVSNADGWGKDIFKSIFYDLEVEQKVSLGELSSIINSKDEVLRETFKALIQEMSFEYNPPDIKAFADKCLIILS